ncbi:hypothetical protein [uncultured Arthrobacter sp.]|uniref:type II toxin-antitoxin system VapC family toxin n=1 Tax=uncultured Arthrobacter sp. TaxID=114050 RepID=UPI003217843A
MARGPAVPLRFGSLLLDAHGVTALAGRSRIVQGFLHRARGFDAPVVVSWITLSEVLQGGTRDPSARWALSNVRLEPLQEVDFRKAGELMATTSMGGHTVDALVAVTAARLPQPCVVLTSDPGDLRRLAAGSDVAVVRI